MQVRSIEVPRVVEAGDDFTLAVKLRNTSNRAVRPRVVVSLSKSAHRSGRVVARERVGRLGADRSRWYEIDVEVPARLSPGRYYVTVCARKTFSRKSCLTADRKLTVVKRSPSPNPPPGEKADVLVLTQSRSAADAHSSTAAGVAALEQAGRTGGFRIDVEEESAGAFTEANLESYRGVASSTPRGTSSATTSSRRSSTTSSRAGLRLRSTRRSRPSRTGRTWTRCSAPAPREPSRRSGRSTINVADRVHDASKSLPERWSHTDAYYRFASNVRGRQHVLGTVAGSAMADHPASWCQDKDGGRAFYVGAGHSAASFADANLVKHLSGAVKWATGQSDPVYSDCGATVLANYKQVKISAPPNLNEPIGFDQLPDGRIIQTARLGQVRLHDPEEGTTDTIANLSQFPQGLYSHSEDGLYGPAVDAKLRPEQVGVPVLLAGGRQGRPAVRRRDAHDPHPDRPGR